MPKLIFIRHAESEYNKAGIFVGRTDCNITQEGIEQAKKLWKEEKQFNEIYCSPLKRAKQTLEALIPNSNPIIDERIVEASIGEWTGKKKDKINKDLVDLFRVGKYTPHGAETPKEIDKRVCNFVEDLFHKYQNDEKILIVTHNGIIKSIKRNFMKNYENIMSKNLEIVTIGEKEFEYYLEQKKHD